jgi:hypothetical protein
MEQTGEEEASPPDTISTGKNYALHMHIYYISLWSCQTVQGKVAVNMNSCTCSFYKSMPLPSRHVLKFREIKGEDLFSNDL